MTVAGAGERGQRKRRPKDSRLKTSRKPCCKIAKNNYGREVAHALMKFFRYSETSNPSLTSANFGGVRYAIETRRNESWR
jgi:hypothetical protein